MSKQLGKYGEILFSQKMTARGYKVEDVSGNPEYWDKDIDFLITSPTTGAIKSFEVKYDTRIDKTGNFYLELTNVHSKGGKGWYTFCEADYLAYGNAAAQEFYVIPLQALRERVKNLPWNMTNCGTDSVGILVKLSDIADLVSLV